MSDKTAVSLVGLVLADRFTVTQEGGNDGVFATVTARDAARDADISLKLLLPQYAADVEIGAVFRVAATAALDLSHLHIALPYFVGADAENNVPCFVAEEPTGDIDLHERLRRTAPIAHRVTVDTIIALAEALQYAAQRGVTHGDIRPAHVATAASPLKLGGFGIAEARLLAAADNPQLLLPSAPYIAPEVWATGTPSVKGDLYALGVILYEMLTGRVPFAGDNALTIARKHTGDPVPVPSDAPALVPRALDGLTQKLLAKRPADRYDGYTDLLADLQIVRDGLRYGRALTWSPLDSKGDTVREAALSSGETETAVMPTGQPPVATVVLPKSKKSPPPATAPLPTAAIPMDVAPLPERSAPLVEPTAPEDAVPEPENEEIITMPATIRKPHSFNWLLPLNLFLATVFVATCGYVVNLSLVAFESPDDVIVPNLVGKSLTEAKTLGLEKKFVVDIINESYSDKYAEDTIYKMNPEPGRHIRQNKKVTVMVSKGPKMVVVPDVYDTSFDRARRIVEKVGLRVGEAQKEWDAITAKGNVTQQIPGAGESRPRGTVVDLTVSKGPEPAPIEVYAATPVLPDENGTTGTYDPDKENAVSLRYDVPPDGADHVIRIDVVDDRGSRTLLTERHKAGSSVPLDVVGYGKRITFKVYDNDEIQSEVSGPPWPKEAKNP